MCGVCVAEGDRSSQRTHSQRAGKPQSSQANRQSRKGEESPAALLKRGPSKLSSPSPSAQAQGHEAQTRKEEDKEEEEKQATNKQEEMVTKKKQSSRAGWPLPVSEHVRLGQRQQHFDWLREHAGPRRECLGRSWLLAVQRDQLSICRGRPPSPWPPARG